MAIKKFFIILFIPATLFLLEESPWLGNVYEFNFLTKYSYSRFSSVNSAVSPLKSTSNDHNLYLMLDFSLPKSLFAAEIRFIDTPRQQFSFSSFALQGRYLLFDDVVGDVVSLVAGADIRGVAGKSVRDVSSYYSGEFEARGNISLGKEFDRLEFWLFRLWALGGIGVANRGSPWLYAKVALEGNRQDKYSWALKFLFNHGYGSRTRVDIDSFRGYGYIRDKSIDILFLFRYNIFARGAIFGEYKRRLYARRCPSKRDTFTFGFNLPFSF